MEQKIEALKEVVVSGKLVVFVGAGVSKNSGVPTWGDLVRNYAKRLGYGQCLNCPYRDQTCHLHCLGQVCFSTDEYLKIPQYYYSAHSAEEYFEVLQETFSSDYIKNVLDDLIVALKPSHIITTNFDHLLDDYGYEVIGLDEDLLKAQSSHYLLKMHGDLSHLEALVLKEDDYLQYSEKHPLMELFIKSLLIDHTFLFVGYSLNDYNLKTFLSWIDFFGREKKVRQKMHKNYLLSVDIAEHEQYLFDYYAHKNIEVIDLNHLPDKLKQKALNCPLTDEIGQLVYAVLEALLE